VHAHLTQALAELPQGQREVFELGAVQGLPYGEVAELLGIPVGTVKSRMFHAVRRMRQLLEGAEDPS
jgi:RNA polymerase sigma-70 factor (ECF subfamily)